MRSRSHRVESELIRVPNTLEAANDHYHALGLTDGLPLLIWFALAPIVPKGERLGFPGYDTFFRQRGPDDILGPSSVPNRGTLALATDFDDPALSDAVDHLHQPLRRQ